MNTYDVGDVVRCYGAFTSNDVDTDPPTVTFYYNDASGNETSLVYGVDPEVVRDSIGHYHSDVTTDEAGVWTYRWLGSGSGSAAAENAFYVLRSHF